MAIINQSNILNLQPGITAPVVVHMSEGDSGTKLSFKLIDGARAWTDPGNVVAAVHGRRQDGTQFGPYACTISGDVVSFQTDAAIAAVAGSGIAQIVLTDSDQNTAGTANIAIMVERATFPMGVTYTNDKSVYEAILAYAQRLPASVTANLTAKIEDEAEERRAADAELAETASEIQSQLLEEVSTRSSQDAVLSARMDEFTKLPDGSLSTAADAELADVRVMANGISAPTAGDAVREQIEELKGDLDDIRQTNRVAHFESAYISGTGTYLTKELSIAAGPGDYYGNIESVTGVTSGNNAAYLAAYDSGGTRLAQVVFSSSDPRTAHLTAPANTAEIRVRLMATTTTSETVSAVYTGISVYSDSNSLKLSLKPSVVIPSVEAITKDIYGTTTSGSRTFDGTGQKNLDIPMEIVEGNSCVVKLTNTDITGTAIVYGYNGSTYTNLKYIRLSTANTVSFVAQESYEKIRISFSLTEIGTSPATAAEITIQPLFNSAYDGTIHVGKGFEYESIQEAIDSAPDNANNHIIIYIHNGEYSEFSTYDNDSRVRYISLIGESRCGVIVRGNKGKYELPTAEICVNGAVRNITFIQETDADHYEGQGAQPYCYAVHDDYYAADTDYENCTFISNAGPALGMGTKKDTTKTFRNCTFINNGDGTYGSIGLGAFFAHTANANDATNQGLHIENCTAINVNGKNGMWLRYISTYTGGTYDVSVRNTGAFGNGSAAAFCDMDLSYSYNNNVPALNVI